MRFRGLALLALLVLSVSAFADSVLYTQPFDGTGTAYASQNDTAGFGLYAQMYDNFNINTGGEYSINKMQWTGEYFNPPQQSPITGWNINFYADSGGQPGALLFAFHVAGNGNETFIGNFGGFPAYTYDVAGINWDPNSGTEYWASVYPDLDFPPQWGWSTSGGSHPSGDGISYQDFFGTRSQIPADMAFTLIGAADEGVPEPGTFLMLGTAVLGAAGAIRRRLL